MTIDQANEIWNACYADPEGKGWALYNSSQRMQAIEVRDAHHNGGQWGVWNISDRD